MVIDYQFDHLCAASFVEMTSQITEKTVLFKENERSINNYVENLRFEMEE